MRNRTTLWSIATGVAVLVLLAAGPSFGSNMGFKLERSLPMQVDHPTFGPVTNFHIFAIPFYRSYADVTDTSVYPDSDADTNPETKEGYNIMGVTNDTVGVVNTDDVLVDLWNADAASDTGKMISLIWYDGATTTFENRAITGIPAVPPFVQLSGSQTPPNNREIESDPTEGFLVTVNGSTAQVQAIVVGSHNPQVTNRILDPAMLFHLIGIPYHTTATHSDCTTVADPNCVGLLELALSGAGDGDACPAGMNPGDMLSIIHFDGSTTDAIGFDGGFGNRAATCAGTTLIFSGTESPANSFPVVPGNGYIFSPVTGGFQPDLSFPHY